MIAEVIEELASKCPYCDEVVISKWIKGGGMLSNPNNVLVADWIYHGSCWDKLIEEHPP